MDLIPLAKEKLTLGMSLRFTVRDEAGAILLAKGQRIETAHQLAGIRARKALFIEVEESEDAVRLIMSGLAELDRAGAPIKDLAKYVHVKKEAEDEKLTGSLVQRWSDVESKLAGPLASATSTPDFEKKIRVCAQHIHSLCIEDSNGSQFLMFNRAVTHFTGYSANHSLLCALLCDTLADVFGLTTVQRESLVCAALTMNVAMTHLQDELAVQKNSPSPLQRSVIDTHAQAGKALLEKVGVSDALWLEVVAHHHAPLEGPDTLADWAPMKKLAKMLQTVDRYTAAMSPRKSRAGRTARDSVKTVVVQAGSNKHDEVGTALVRILGLSPPGTYVKLTNGETAVVMRRGLKPAEPVVAVVLNRNDEPIAEPRLRDTSRDVAIQATLAATTVRVNLKLDVMLRMMPRNPL